MEILALLGTVISGHSTDIEKVDSGIAREKILLYKFNFFLINNSFIYQNFLFYNLQTRFGTLLRRFRTLKIIHLKNQQL